MLFKIYVEKVLQSSTFTVNPKRIERVLRALVLTVISEDGKLSPEQGVVSSPSPLVALLFAGDLCRMATKAVNCHSSTMC